MSIQIPAARSLCVRPSPFESRVSLGSKLSVPRLCYFFDIFVLQTISVTPRRKISAKGTKFLCQTRGFSLAAVSTPRTFQAKPKKPPRSNSNNKEKGGDGKGQKVMGLHGLWRRPRDKSANGPKGEEESIDAGHKYKNIFFGEDEREPLLCGIILFFQEAN